MDRREDGQVATRPAPPGLALLLLVAPGCHAPPAPVAPSPLASAVGLNLHADRYDTVEETRRFDAVAALGVHQVRLAVEWGRLEPTPDTWDWSALDHALDLAEARDIEVLQVLAYSAPWAASVQGDPMTRPARLEDWVRFVRAAALRYRGRIHAWEVWNEPNADTFWHGGPGWDPQQRFAEYRDLLAVTRREIKAVDADNLVVFGGLAHTTDNWQTDLDAWYALDAVSLCDVLAIHPYAGGDPQDPRWYPRYIDQILDGMARHGDAGRPVWVTETGIPTAGHELAVDEHEQARRLPGLFTVPLSHPQIRRVYWYDLQDDPTGDHFGLLRPDGSEKPAAATLRALLDDHR